VDQAALRSAASYGIPIGGWCPPGRVCEAGNIPGLFPLTETPADRSPDTPDVPRSQRTEWNVRDSDATLVLWPATLRIHDPGTRWTAEVASRYQKPLLVCDPTDSRQRFRVRKWIEQHNIQTLNVAGPSERTSPGIGALAEQFLGELLRDDIPASDAGGVE
jgi:hypothetical protein